MRSVKNIALFAAIFSSLTPVLADTASDLAEYVGWEIIHAGRVTGFIEENGKRSDDFEGCEWGRKIIIDDRFTVTCTSYSYSYSYSPKAVVIRNGSRLQLIVGNNKYAVSR